MRTSGLIQDCRSTFATRIAHGSAALNENTNGLLRQYFPKGTDLSLHSADELAAIAMTLNSRPRKTLGWKTPAEALDQYLREAKRSVATTI
jgi:IS30 family transposase